MRSVFRFLTAALLLWGLVFGVRATESTARNISADIRFSDAGLEDYAFLTDGVDTEGAYISHSLRLSGDTGIAALSLVFDQPCVYTLRSVSTDAAVQYDSGGFLHCFSDVESDLGQTPAELILEFPAGAVLCEVQAYSQGTLPDSVQCWQQPLTGGADIVLFSTHGDDEQLYFAGLLPWYAGELGLDVQVVYMTGHAREAGSVRMHEMLNGLWAVGVRAYPVFGYFPDFKLPYREHTYLEYERMGYSRAELLGYVVENLRRFRPQVAVGHDLNGEYGHGMHKVYADLLTQAVQISGDPESFAPSAERYGTWDVPKTYLHLYGENQVIMDWDQPLERFDGLTAFQVCQQLGFPCHATQQYDQYVYWLYGPNKSFTKATDIKSWSPCVYGLYRSTVGEDAHKNDLMENLISYGEQARIQEEQAQALRQIREQAQKQAQQATESQQIRPPDATTQPPEQQVQLDPFPVWAAVLAVFCLAGSVAILVILKKIEKN